MNLRKWFQTADDGSQLIGMTMVDVKTGDIEFRSAKWRLRLVVDSGSWAVGFQVYWPEHRLRLWLLPCLGFEFGYF